LGSASADGGLGSSGDFFESQVSSWPNFSRWLTAKDIGKHLRMSATLFSLTFSNGFKNGTEKPQRAKTQ
jgi:hypothetical protein